MIRSRAATWQNWGHSARSRPAEIATPANEDALIDMINRVSRNGGHIRPVGSGHSFTPVAATESVLLRLDEFTGLRRVDEATGDVTFGAGTKLQDIPALLAPYGLAMENLGDIDAQTLAGAISTGTHGTGLAFTGLAGQVQKVRVALASGTVVEASKDTNAELFSVARLGLGAFGVLTEVTVRCVPQFLLRAEEHPEPLDELLDDFAARAGAVDHLEFYLFPHTHTAAVKENTRLPVSETPAPRSAIRAVIDDEITQNGLFGGMCMMGTALPSTIPSMNKVAAQLMSRSSYVDHSTGVLTTRRRVRFREMEYGIDLDALPHALRSLTALITDRDWKISFPIEVRIAASDEIPLSTAYRRPTAYVAIHRYYREPYARYFLAAQDILSAHGGRPHWGKLHSLTADDLRTRYPDFDYVTALRAAVDPDGLWRNDYLGRVLGY